MIDELAGPAPWTGWEPTRLDGGVMDDVALSKRADGAFEITKTYLVAQSDTIVLSPDEFSLLYAAMSQHLSGTWDSKGTGAIAGGPSVSISPANGKVVAVDGYGKCIHCGAFQGKPVG